jgi:hypothetical protein
VLDKSCSKSNLVPACKNFSTIDFLNLELYLSKGT